MDYPIKICPRCKTQLQQGNGAFELVKKETGNSKRSPGLPIALYVCPECGYIELYDLGVIGRI